MNATGLVQSDLVAEIAGGPHYSELIERRLNRGAGAAQDTFSVLDVAAVFEVGETKVRDWIRSGRLCAANLSAGMTAPVDPELEDGERRPLRPLWRLTREAILNHARNMEGGI